MSPYRTVTADEIDGIVVTFVDVTPLKHAEAALRESERKLAAELELTRRLHRMSLSVATAGNMAAALDHVLGAAVDLEGGRYGNIQMVDETSQQLRIVAQHGFERPFLECFGSVGLDDPSSFGRAWRIGRTCQVDDVMTDPEYAPYRDVAAEAGYRAVQSTPLIERGGKTLGVLSVHFREPRVFGERDQRIGALLGQQAADLLVSRLQQEKLTELNDALRGRTVELEQSQQQLSRQAAELIEQDRHRQEFLAALGHELRNPMAAIHSSLEVISVADDTSQRALGILKRQSQHMARLVNDLLDVTRVKHGRLILHREVIDINQSALAATEAARGQAERRKLNARGTRPGSRHPRRRRSGAAGPGDR